MKNLSRKLLFTICFSSVSLSALGALIPDGDYEIFCNSRNGGIRYLGAPDDEGVVNIYAQQTTITKKWSIKSTGNGLYHISHNTKTGRAAYLEACPKYGMVVTRFRDSTEPDQDWSITSIGNGTSIVNDSYHISCNTRNEGMRNLEAFPLQDSVKPKPLSLDQDQVWKLRPIIRRSSMLIVNSNRYGVHRSSILILYPGKF